LTQLENDEEYLTFEDRVAAAKPVFAGAYWELFDDFRAAQHLFSDEVALVDEACRDKKDKKDFGKRTAAVREWFRELPQSKKDEAKKAAEKWNSEGAHDKNRMHV
jgi:hypothetical protein